MHNHFRQRLTALLLALMLLLSTAHALAKENILTVSSADYPVSENGQYNIMEEVAVYLATFQRLPDNFIKKKEAEAMGWNNRQGNLDKVAPGCAIGGDYFGNYEFLVPSAQGRKWTECDINFDGGYRGGERIVFSNDGLIYYSNDHYSTFAQVEVSLNKNKYITKTDKKASAKDDEKSEVKVKKNSEYFSKNEVAAYIHQFGKLPKNYLTKADAKKLGWSNRKDNLASVAPDCAIGGDVFQNREQLLPTKKDRIWYECDVSAKKGKRGEKRIVYSSDGLIYYSSDNHKSFTQLY